MDIGESANAAVINEDKPKEEEKEKKKKVKIRYSVFFDGTLNNRINTDIRLKSESKKNTDSEDKKANEIYEKYKGLDSYENDYTNVAKIETYIKNIEKAPEYIFTSYIEGPGTNNEEDEEFSGYVLGVGDTGIREKVKKGVDDVLLIIKKHVKNDVIIDELIIDVFGFSRGAAGARNFIYEALFGDELESIEQRLTKDSYTVNDVYVDFAGLFDTVSSHGIVYFNDVSDLKLNAVVHANKVIQLASADEHRERFSLTNIRSARFKGREIFLPGVHSDVGGCYRDKKEEKKVIFDSWTFNVKEDRDRLIKLGWFKENEITIEEYSDNDEDYESYSISRIKRNKVSNHYSRIPLQIMARFARENKIKISNNLESDENIKGQTLIEINKRIKKYIEDTDPKNNGKIYKESKIDDWHVDDELMKKLRNEYLHFSAQWSIGLMPRMSFWKNKRYRKIYNG